jgi:rhodanese-related sulfurtransferase
MKLLLRHLVTFSMLLLALSVSAEDRIVGEPEIFNFMEHSLRDNEGLLIDARTSEWYQCGTILSSINIPFTHFSDAGSPETVKALESFGAVRRVDVGTLTRMLEEMGFMEGVFKTEQWDFTNVKKLVFWCNRPACGQSPRAIKGLLKTGYPPEKILYSRSGMQTWQLWGLTAVFPG